MLTRVVVRVLQGLTKVLGGRRPLLYSYQGSLPKLPVPGLRDTMQRVSYQGSLPKLPVPSLRNTMQRVSALHDATLHGWRLTFNHSTKFLVKCIIHHH